MTKFRVFVVSFIIVFANVACGRDSETPKGADADRWPARSSTFTSVEAHYGPLIIQDGEFEAEAEVKPWSSWWYPVRDSYLFESDGTRVSPLEKYDRFVLAQSGKNPGAAAYEREKFYDRGANSWEGLCNAWAIASIMEPEPKKAVTLGNVAFGVGDQKALLIKSYEKIQGSLSFGQRYNGDRTSHFDDLYPDQLHGLLVGELFKNGRAFVMDKDPGVPVWNTPVWKAQYQIQRDPADQGIAHVTTWLFGASPFVDSYDFVGTLTVVFEYTYDLMGDVLPDGSLQVRYGIWTGTSADFHPDFATILPESIQRDDRESLNSKLQTFYVDKILRTQ